MTTNRPFRRLPATAMAALLAFSASAFPIDDPPAKPANDGIKGPKVPDESLKSDKPFAGGGKGRAPQSRPMLELRVMNAAIDGLGLEGEQKDKVAAVRAEFMTRLETYEKQAAEKRKQLAEQRKKAPSDQPPSEEWKKEMQALENSRPKLDELKKGLSGVLTPEQMDLLKQRFDEGLKKARAEMTKRAEEERKKKEEAMKEGGGKPSDAPAGEKPRRGGKKQQDTPAMPE
ncbi:MAG: hypothetical protein LW636_06945 [Planctomycetaceae bacterium]|nr:hypothetical protein [Planctomycetaceae bacterium]